MSTTDSRKTLDDSTKTNALRAEEGEEHVALQRFRQYLRIPSVQPNIDYTPCVAFLRQVYSIVDGIRIRVNPDACVVSM